MIRSPHNPVLLFWSLWLAALPSLAAPRLHCDSPKYDFGTVIGQEKVMREFILWNRGDSPVQISKIKNCCGVESTIIPMKILPGSNAVCTSIFTTRNRYGKQDKQILIASNDRKNPYFELKIVGTLLKPVEFSPRWIRLGNLMPDSIVSETISATNLLDRVVEFQSVESTITGVQAHVVDGGDDSASENPEQRRSWSIELSTTEELQPGKINGQIQLHFSSGTVNVPVIGTVKPIIQIVPEKIQFTGRPAKETERLVMLRSGDGRTFEVFSAKLAKGEGSVVIKRLADDRWQLKLMVQPDTIQPGASIIIKTSIESQDTNLIPRFR
ncbi:DUF1573 domain-containing protein [Pontiellaceae bacterium B1224]|nr:DUF1573 domain-containing protein [Pontiellaceae bacterium B1224]